MQLSKNIKTKKICKSKKELQQYVQSLPSDIQDLQLIFQLKQKPMEFSEMCKDQSIIIRSSFEASVNSQRFRQGQITLNRKLQQITEWKLKMCSISLAAQFGICQVRRKTNKIGKTYGLYSAGYAPAKQQQTGHQFEGDIWVKLTYNPQQHSLLLFNDKTKKSYMIQIPQKKQDFDYYPYVFLYKSTVYLNEEPDDDPFDQDYYNKMYQDHIKQSREQNIEAKQK